MKTYGVRGVQLHSFYSFVFRRKYKGVKLLVSSGDEVKKGDIVSMGIYPKTVYSIEITDIPKGDIQVLNGEVVTAGQILTSSDISGIRVKKNISPVDGVVNINSKKLYITDGHKKVSESVVLGGTVRDTDDDTYTIECPASSFFYNFALGSTDQLVGAKFLRVLDYDKPNTVVVGVAVDVLGKFIMVKRNLMPVLYKQLVRLGAIGVICGGIRYSDYLSIKKSYPSLPIPIFVCNGWGVRSIPSKIYNLCTLSRGGEAYVQVAPQTFNIFTNKLFIDKEQYVDKFHTIQKGTTVMLPGYEYLGKEGVVERIVDDELHILTNSGRLSLSIIRMY